MRARALVEIDLHAANHHPHFMDYDRGEAHDGPAADSIVRALRWLA
jgi:hypothetical protein